MLRKAHLEVPVRVEYGLSEQARKLRPIMIQLIQWNTERNSGA